MKLSIEEVSDRAIALVAIPFFVAVVLVALIVFFYITTHAAAPVAALG